MQIYNVESYEAFTHRKRDCISEEEEEVERLLGIPVRSIY